MFRSARRSCPSFWRLHHARQTGRFCGLMPVPVHSTHVAAETTLHYRWHPYFGKKVRRYHSVHRSDGEFVYVEKDPGIVLLLPAWMLDLTVCSTMQLGTPRVALHALCDLHETLMMFGFRPDSSGDDTLAEHNNEEFEDKVGGGTAATRNDIQKRCHRQPGPGGGTCGGDSACTSASGGGERDTGGSK